MNTASRLAILANLPERGTVLEMISKRNIRKKIDFTSEEFARLNLKENNGRITWNPEVSIIIDVEFNDAEITLLKSIINIMDNKHIITDNILDFISELQQ